MTLSWDSPLEVIITQGLSVLTRSSLELPEMRPPAGVTIIVAVVSKAFKAGQDPHAKNRKLGLADSLGTSHCRILGREKFQRPTLGLYDTEAGGQMEGKCSPHHTSPPASLKLPGKKNKMCPQTSPHWNGRPALLKRVGSEVISGFIQYHK